MRIVAFFNSKGGVGKTSLVYHLAWMFQDLGYRVLAADLDPQANLSAAFLDESELEGVWPDGPHPLTIAGSLQPLIDSVGDVAPPAILPVSERLALLIGDMRLSRFEDELSQTWPLCLDRNQRAFRVTSAFFRALGMAGAEHRADVALVDVGPSLGAINRAALIGAEHVVVPLAPDLFSLQGLKNLAPTLRAWRGEWNDRQQRCPVPDLALPAGTMAPAGYVILQHAVRLDRPVKAYAKWLGRIPAYYRAEIMNEAVPHDLSAAGDPHCLALLKHYRSLMPLAQDARKPMFHLKAADGALGAHARAAQECYSDFKALAERIAERCGIVQGRPR